MRNFPYLGPCCCCGGRRRVRNIIMLDRRASVPGTGWGCAVCGLPLDGASYVACDGCVEADVLPREVFRGYADSGDREPIANLSTVPFEHDMTKHEERSPVVGLVLRRCPPFEHDMTKHEERSSP